MVGMTEAIVAVSSPGGASGRGVVRASGTGLGDVIDLLFGAGVEIRTLQTARMRLGDGLEVACLVLWCPGPGTFTGEDVLEVQVPGHGVLLEKVMGAMLKVFRVKLEGGGRLAEGGEFSQRAFLNGKIDLTRAEGIAATIGAVSDAQLEAARLLRTGKLGQWAETLTDRYGMLLGLVEAGIDFVDEEDVVVISAGDLDAGLKEVEAEVEGLLGRSRSWGSLEGLAWVVLVGEPNAGKSTLFNYLLGHERAVTSGAAGTTRDVLSEPMRVSEGEVMLVDVAGLGGEVDEAGVVDGLMRAAAQGAVERAELVLWVRACDGEARELSDEVRSWVGKAPVLEVWSKCDLEGAKDRAGYPVSGLTGAGVEMLRGKIESVMRDRAVSLGGRVMALQERHRDRLSACLEAVVEARGLVAGSLVKSEGSVQEMELVAGVMREGLDALGELGGVMTADDVIGKIFSTFCIGK